MSRGKYQMAIDYRRATTSGQSRNQLVEPTTLDLSTFPPDALPLRLPPEIWEDTLLRLHYTALETCNYRLFPT